MTSVLIKNIGLLQTPIGSNALKGEKQGENLKLKNASILIEDGKIKEITDDGRLPEYSEVSQVIDAGGKLVTPGLVESHTHMIFGGYRQSEIPLKIKGATYLEILAAGGGIMDTVRETKKASFDELYNKTYGFLDEMKALGVTTAEAKSGYGLDFENEVKCLEVLKKLNEDHDVDLVSTFMGAHAVPAEYKGKEEDFIKIMTDKVMPYVKENKLADFADIFLEEGVFDVEQSKPYLEKAKELGFKIKVHADEIVPIGGSVLAGQMGATSCEHLIAVDEKGIDALAKGGTIACCLPGTSFYLGANYAPCREMINKSVAVAIATDFNPGSCPSLNIQLAMNIAMLKYKLVPEEILTATTLNAAAAIGREKTAGSLEVGKDADIVIWDVNDFDMVCYRYGSNQVNKTIKRGKVIWKKN